jgi:hypothetical protein
VETIPKTIVPELQETETITRPLPEETIGAAIAQVVGLAEDLAIAAQVRARIAEDTGERLTLHGLIRDQGFDPADFGVE